MNLKDIAKSDLEIENEAFILVVRDFSAINLTKYQCCLREQHN